MPLLFTVTNVGVFLPLLLPLLVAAALVVDSIWLGSGENMMLDNFVGNGGLYYSRCHESRVLEKIMQQIVRK